MKNKDKSIALEGKFKSNTKQKEDQHNTDKVDTNIERQEAWRRRIICIRLKEKKSLTILLVEASKVLLR